MVLLSWQSWNTAANSMPIRQANRPGFLRAKWINKSHPTRVLGHKTKKKDLRCYVLNHRQVFWWRSLQYLVSISFTSSSNALTLMMAPAMSSFQCSVLATSDVNSFSKADTFSWKPWVSIKPFWSSLAVARLDSICFPLSSTWSLKRRNQPTVKKCHQMNLFHPSLVGAE